jgi:hypothetical protein
MCQVSELFHLSVIQSAADRGIYRIFADRLISLKFILWEEEIKRLKKEKFLRVLLAKAGRVERKKRRRKK